ncbi:MAG: hypothetical protein MJZ55_04305, partial [Paludibacteraceae bacterium]|nr:hypothetical protein [Paludibacteraceae bacterium]
FAFCDAKVQKKFHICKKKCNFELRILNYEIKIAYLFAIILLLFRAKSNKRCQMASPVHRPFIARLLVVYRKVTK